MTQPSNQPAPPPIYGQTERYFAGALADWDQVEANFKANVSPEEWKRANAEVDEGVELFRDLCELFDEADGKNPLFKQAWAVACSYMRRIGEDFACCPAHGEYLVATARMMASVIPRDKQYEGRDRGS